ncbi:phosphoglycolate phosphatase-like HAD superfamily hydrolase [Aurantimonas endophytica]|uniref:Phosphoglycolate phosphatase-like HAD superfamily hydrolase n=1 Tax=Aurantimonas endophytica TaxID=1522175 RepID=A0A7W6MS21_9HYPH|nr:phosphoglycolate phosphatase-like HAD superfamily hydrolase [Aurantimonas endophytica]
MDFVTAVTTDGGADYVEPANRIAVFDNDGTLWSEQPMYVQLAFALDRVKTLAPDHPEWKETEPFKSVLAGDMKGVAAFGIKGLVEIVAATHSGMTSDEFTAIAKDWIASATHPTTGKPYTSMIYQPMRELIDYLKANDFRVFIVSGGGIEFMRPWTEVTYAIPPENVVGSSIKTKYEMHDGKPAVVRLPEIEFIDDGAGKPVGIQKFIGKRPIAAFGNSDGDFQMLEWTTGGEGRRFGLIVHHDDADRDVAYDRDSTFGKLDRGLDDGPRQGWTIVSMKNDWKQVFPE